MDTPLIIRAASHLDLPQLLALYLHLDPHDRLPPLDVAERRLEELQHHHGSAIFIGAVDGALVASCTLIVIPNLTRGGLPYGLIENVVTHTAFRRRGFGQQILQAAVAAAWQFDCYKVMLMTETAVDIGVLHRGGFRAEQDRLSNPAHCSARGAIRLMRFRAGCLITAESGMRRYGYPYRRADLSLFSRFSPQQGHHRARFSFAA
jgi:GNAT superfamily N-acetyltransferase